MKIQFEDKIINLEKSDTIQNILKDEIKSSQYVVVGAVFNNTYVNLNYQVQEDGKVELIDVSSKVGSKIYRATLVYILAKAFETLYPDKKLDVNYQLNNSMFCDVEDIDITEEMIQNVSDEMRRIVKKNLPIRQVIMNREQAKKFYEENNTAKGKLQYDLEDNDKIYMYFCEDYYNYCYSTIANRTGVAKIFELIKYDNGFLMRYPSSSAPNQLPKLIQTKKACLGIK